MNYSKLSQVLLPIAASFVVGLSVTLFSEKIGGSGNIDIVTILSVVACLLTLIILYIFNVRNSKTESIAYNVAVVGFPQSGKTTMITNLFSSIMYGRIRFRGLKPIVKGESTIERINENISNLEKGIPVGSTNDQSMFAYRVNLLSEKSLFLPSTNYQMEIGDFPGENTDEFIDIDKSTWIVRSEYFNWIVEADVFIFVIDLAQYRDDADYYKADITKSIRKAWQNILEINSPSLQLVGGEDKYNVNIVFNKFDVLLRTDNKISFEDDRYANSSLNRKLPKILKINNDHLLNLSVGLREDLLDDFSDLISFFKVSGVNANVVFLSSFLANHRSNLKYGFEELARNIFPKV